MRMILFHNPSAGSENHTVDDLIAKIRRAGHEVASDVSDHDELSRELAKHCCDWVVVAGGDGTVGRAARVVSDRGVPLAILPLGTANNIARTLGFLGEDGERQAEDLIEAWRDSDVVTFDLGDLTVAGQDTGFVEAVGFGVFPDVMRATESQQSPDDPSDTLARDWLVFRAAFERAQPRRYTIVADGQDRSGDYLLVELVNIPFIGPKLPLVPQTDPHDGLFDLVVVGESERSHMLDLLEDARLARSTNGRLPALPVKQVRVTFRDRHYHCDGTLCELPSSQASAALEATVRPAALQVLRPRSR